MRRNPFRLVELILAVFALTACTATYPVVGYFNQYNELIKGTVVNNLLTGSSTIQVVAVNSNVKGKGSSRVTYTPLFGGAGTQGIAVVDFEDGRRISCDYTIHGWIYGDGTGTDQDGHPVTFTFGMTEEKAMALIEEQKKRFASKPDLPPVYAPKETREEVGYCTGTGFFVSAACHLVTNFHAVLKVNASATPLSVAGSSGVEKGCEVFTLGYPLIQLQGNEQKATFGRVNALSGIKGDSRFLQIDVPIQPGNSGGPLIDTRGRVVGIATMTLNGLRALRESGALPQNVNYALKSEYISPLVASITGSLIAPPADKTSDFAQLVRKCEPSVMLIVAK